MSRATVTPPSSAGFFGKLPSRGDFIGRALPNSFLQPWEDWLQAALAQSRQQLGKTWADAYCVSPIWRFALSAGLCSSSAYAGILMPSVDRVNRYYPLLIAAPLAAPAALLTLPQNAWFDTAEQLALSALAQDELDVEAFSERVQALGVPACPSSNPSNASTSQAWHYQIPAHVPFSSLGRALADDLLSHSFAQPSLWWSAGSAHIARCLLLCEGMLPPTSFVALLVGDWKKWGWHQKLLTAIEEPFAAGEAGLS